MKQINDETVRRVIRLLLDHRGHLWSQANRIILPENKTDAIDHIGKLNELIAELKSLEPAPLPATLESTEDGTSPLRGKYAAQAREMRTVIDGDHMADVVFDIGKNGIDMSSSRRVNRSAPLQSIVASRENNAGVESFRIEFIYGDLTRDSVLLPRSVTRGIVANAMRSCTRLIDSMSAQEATPSEPVKCPDCGSRPPRSFFRTNLPMDVCCDICGCVYNVKRLPSGDPLVTRVLGVGPLTSESPQDRDVRKAWEEGGCTRAGEVYGEQQQTNPAQDKNIRTATARCPYCDRQTILLTDFPSRIHCLCGKAYDVAKVDGEWRVAKRLDLRDLVPKKLESNPDIVVTPKEPAPPIGVISRSIWIEHRLRDLHEAIGRRMEHLKTTELGKSPFDLQSHQWISEAFELSKELIGAQDKPKHATGGVVLIHRGDA